MNGPKCKQCGQRHWPADGCHGERQPSWIARQTASVTPQLVKERAPASVTPSVTQTSVTPWPVTPCRECERLRGELDRMRDRLRQLEASMVTVMPADRVGRSRVQAAERMRRMRQRRRAAAVDSTW